MPKARRNLPPRRNVFRDGTHPVPVRPGGTAGNIAESSDPSNPDSPGNEEPAGIRRNGADGHQAGDNQRPPAIAWSGNSRISNAARPLANCMSTARGLDPLKAALSHHRRRLERIPSNRSIKERQKRIRPRTDLKYPWV